MRELLRDLRPTIQMELVGTHSLKATLLSMMAKAGCDTGLRRLAGYHTDPGVKVPLEYSRDGQALVLHALQAISMVIQQGYFDPDTTRARRWPRRPITTLELAMADMAKMSAEDGWYQVHNRASQDDPKDDEALLVEWEHVTPETEGYSQSEPMDDLFGDADSISSASVQEERPDFQCLECNTSDEEHEAEVAARILGEALARDLSPPIHVTVFRHVVSGCCHIAKETNVDPDDGDAIVLKCGKIATRNFEEIQLAGNFLPYKC